MTGTEQWKGSSPARQSPAQHSCFFQVALQGKGVIWEKLGPSTGGNLVLQRGTAGWGVGKLLVWRILRAVGTEL